MKALDICRLVPGKPSQRKVFDTLLFSGKETRCSAQSTTQREHSGLRSRSSVLEERRVKLKEKKG